MYRDSESTLHMEYRGIGTIFGREKLHNLRCWPYNCPELRQDLKSFHCDGKIIKLPGSDINNIGFFFLEKIKLGIAKRSVVKETPVFPGFFLGSFLDGSVTMDDYIVIVPDAIDLDPPITRSHPEWHYILIFLATNIYILLLKKSIVTYSY